MNSSSTVGGIFPTYTVVVCSAGFAGGVVGLGGVVCTGICIIGLKGIKGAEAKGRPI